METETREIEMKIEGVRETESLGEIKRFHTDAKKR